MLALVVDCTQHGASAGRHGSMTDSIGRADAGACRLPGDEPDHEDDARAGAVTANQSEKPRQACMVDVDWNERGSHAETPFGPPAPPVPNAKAPATPAKPAVPQSTNNATRTSERELASGPYAAAGYSQGGHALHAGAALVKGRDASGLELEAVSVSGQIGAQSEAQGAVGRVGVSGKLGGIGGDLATANAHAGIHNPDGSTGLNAGAGAVLIAGEVTLSGKANSVSLGAGLGVGGELSVGLRDKDGDGQPEVCFRVSTKFAMVGACIELPFHGKM
jgi:hypothetical protein